MTVIMASIGRNIGETPMSRRDWIRFINDVSDAIRHANEQPEFHFGTGTWNGVTEDSVHITVYRESDEYVPHLFGIRQTLANIAARYGQDAIALTISNPELIGANNG